MINEYQTVTGIAGPLIIAEKIEGAKFDEVVEIELPTTNTTMRKSRFSSILKPKYLFSLSTKDTQFSSTIEGIIEIEIFICFVF